MFVDLEKAWDKKNRISFHFLEQFALFNSDWTLLESCFNRPFVCFHSQLPDFQSGSLKGLQLTFSCTAAYTDLSFSFGAALLATGAHHAHFVPPC